VTGGSFEWSRFSGAVFPTKHTHFFKEKFNMKQLLFCGVWLLMATGLWGQHVTLSGTVTDHTGEALIGASVKFLQKNTFVQGRITDIDGRYLVNLPPGTYDLEVSYAGFKTLKISDLSLKNSTTLDLKFAEPDHDIGPVIRLCQPILVLDQSNTSTGQVFTSRQIRQRF
jgi:Carboxypeptidase regulatory-like domain